MSEIDPMSEIDIDDESEHPNPVRNPVKPLPRLWKAESDEPDDEIPVRSSKSASKGKDADPPKSKGSAEKPKKKKAKESAASGENSDKKKGIARGDSVSRHL